MTAPLSLATLAPDPAEHGLGALAGIGAANSGDDLGGAFRGVVNDAKTGIRVL